MQAKLLEAFYEMIPDNKKVMFDAIAAERTRHITVVLENIYQEHNASAVMRSCESLGVQELHVIESKNQYKAQRDIARGAGQWIELYNYDSQQPVADCLAGLKERGYRIAILTPEADSHSIFDVPIDEPLALVFGTEWEGISDKAREMADLSVSIPMVGFTESFNVSVSVALSLQAIRHRLESASFDWKLSEEEQIAVKLNWCQHIMKNGEAVRRELITRLANQEQVS
ncbi:MAG TPA: RNA methyltransferase [Fluviicola sp.]|nr:RNA methyltransferase [Fluviicola sp.]